MSMAAGDNHIQQEIDTNGKGLVGNEKASSKGVPANAERPVRGLNWTEILSKAGLESPGYRETIDKMKADGRLK
jgi:hypothetical protein